MQLKHNEEIQLNFKKEICIKNFFPYLYLYLLFISFYIENYLKKI